MSFTKEDELEAVDLSQLQLWSGGSPLQMSEAQKQRPVDREDTPFSVNADLNQRISLW